jgi:hypothetical protein
MDTRDSGGLRSLASDFLTLQGLHQVVLGIIWLLVFAASEVNSAWDIWLFPAAVVLTGIALWRIRVYYERWFGYVEFRTRPGFWGSGQPFLRRGLFWIPSGPKRTSSTVRAITSPARSPVLASNPMIK